MKMKIVRILMIIIALSVFFLMSEAIYAVDSTDAKPSSDWSGAYIGAFAAHVWANLEYYEPDWLGFERNPNINGFAGGIFSGYSFKNDKIVWGIEGDAGSGNLKEGPDRSIRNNYSAFDINWNAHVRGRIGFVSKSTLFYAAGGMAFAKITVDDTDPNWDQDSAIHSGWTFGAGIEHKITKRLSARVEYLYDDYGSKEYYIHGISPYRADVDLTAHIIRVGLSYHF